MKTFLLTLVVLMVNTGLASQETEDKYPLNEFFDLYFEGRGLNVILKFNDPESESTVYTIDGIKELSGIDTKLHVVHESYRLFEKVSIQTRFAIEELWSIKERYDLINEWATPSYPANIFWDKKRKTFVLTVSTIVFSKSKTVSVARIDDMYLGFIAALKDLNDSQTIKFQQL
ncbi:hypothetical protein [Allomuricauda sp. ARW1Y1]|jgi:hypothetical protein|uniref:hypothetical protein n=1 Tax=Allomuricauda sp. ARW1Y1 TaxID=2663843 RepID=UPI0015C7DB36|nr:hypothetical protein [Muricauda sp. ARW1Y1]NYJ26632.1 hypothetical protein [Muricauda sp. ARW1Y1]